MTKRRMKLKMNQSRRIKEMLTTAIISSRRRNMLRRQALMECQSSMDS